MARPSVDPQTLEEAALELYEERGFTATTAAQIAERAGVTERTFFRHFADKREVLFGREAALADELGRAVRAAPARASSPVAARAGLRVVAELLQPRHADLVRRVRVIAAEQPLRERELMKLASWTSVLRAALVDRGEDPDVADVVAVTGVGLLDVAARRWLAGPASALLVAELDETFAALGRSGLSRLR